MKVCILDESSQLLQHTPERNNCECGNQIILEVGDVVRVMPFTDTRNANGERYRNHLSFEEPRMFQIVCPVCFRGIVWEIETPHRAYVADGAK